MATIGYVEFYVNTAPLITIGMNPIVNITSWHATFTMRDEFRGNILIQTPATVFSGAGGVWHVLLSALQTAIEPQSGVFDLYRTDSGFEDVLAVGPCQALPCVTPAQP